MTEPARGSRAMTMRFLYELIVMAFEMIGFLLVVSGFGVAAYQAVGWPGFLVVCGGLMLAGTQWYYRMVQRPAAEQARQRQQPVTPPPVTRSRDTVEAQSEIIRRVWWRVAILHTELKPRVICRTWGRFAWLSKE